MRTAKEPKTPILGCVLDHTPEHQTMDMYSTYCIDTGGLHVHMCLFSTRCRIKKIFFRKARTEYMYSNVKLGKSSVA